MTTLIYDGIHITDEQLIGVTSIRVAPGITEIPPHAFMMMQNITSFHIPDSVLTIGLQAFCRCVALRAIAIPDSVVTIGEMCFQGCATLRDVTLPRFLNKIPKFCFDDCALLENIQLPIGVTAIEQAAFSRCWALGPTINIPRDCTTFGPGCFAMCQGLSSIEFSEDHLEIHKIDELQFLRCTGLKTFVIPRNVTRIEDHGKCVVFVRPWGLFRQTYGGHGTNDIYPIMVHSFFSFV